MTTPIRLTALERAVTALEEGLREYAQHPHLLTVRDGVIQRYEIALDVASQLTVRVLKDVFGIDEAPARKDTFREAARLGLVADARDLLRRLEAHVA